MGATINNVGPGSQTRDEINSLAVSYMGKPLHLLASLLGAMLAQLLSRLLSLFMRNKEIDQAAAFDKPAPPSPQQPLVRLKNLPQVSGCIVLEAGEALFRFGGAPRFVGSTAVHCSGAFLAGGILGLVTILIINIIDFSGSSPGCVSLVLLQYEPTPGLERWLTSSAPSRAFICLAQSEEYFVNKRGNVIHFRSYVPESADAIKALVLFSHG